MTELATTLIALAFWAPYAWTRLRRLTHILQLEEYENRRFLRWSYTQLQAGAAMVGPISFAGLAVVVAAGFVLEPGGIPNAIATGGGLGAIGVDMFRRRPKAPQKKPLRWTARAIRLASAATLLLAAFALAAVWLGGPLLALPAVGIGVGLSAPLFLAAGNLLMAPVEWTFRQYYLWDARRKLRAVAPLVIGVTGSYGKTTTREIVYAVCSAAGPSLRPPANFNTPMGMCITIRGSLRPSHRYYVAEMGAYLPGNIRELCGIAAPSISIMTAIGPVHLERFRTIERIVSTKYEIIQALPASGLGIFNVDDARLRPLADATSHCRVLRYGLDPAHAPDVTALNIEVGPSGVAFDAVLPGREPIRVRLPLLGQHNVSNALAALCVAHELKLSSSAIRSALAAVQPPEHRLQLVRAPGGATIIDDSYNANPAGVAAALEVLRDYPAKTRVLVTPGMVELGEHEEEENRLFGERAAKVCDYVILVGPKRTAPIAKGLLAAGFPKQRAVLAQSLADVPPALSKIVGAGDVVLFCNDLPDQYAE